MFVAAWILWPCVRSLIPSIHWLKCMHIIMRRLLQRVLLIVLCTFFCCHDRFVEQKYEHCCEYVSAIPSISMMFSEFTDNISDGLTCFDTKISTDLINRLLDIIMLHQQFIIQIIIKVNSFQYFTMAKTWNVLEEANEGMSTSFLLIYKIKPEFSEITPFFYFSFHSEQGIRLNVEQFFV